jgi:hypothetical protein
MTAQPKPPLQFRGYLTLSPDGSMALHKNQPRSAPGGARIMALELSVPRSLFEVPQLRAAITVTEEQATQLSIDTEAMASALSPIVGAEVAITVVYPKPTGGEE